MMTLEILAMKLKEIHELNVFTLRRDTDPFSGSEHVKIIIHPRGMRQGEKFFIVDYEFEQYTLVIFTQQMSTYKLAKSPKYFFKEDDALLAFLLLS